MILTSESTTTLTLTLTREDAQRILNDFDHKREPSEPGKRLTFALSSIVRQESDHLAEMFGRKATATTESEAR